MIVKKEEWDNLVNAKELLEKEYITKFKNIQKERNELQDEVFRLQKSIKPDEINLQLFYYNIDRYNSERLLWQIKLPQTLNLSRGITNQVLRILKQISNNIEDEFKEKYKLKIIELENSNKKRYDWFHDNLKTFPIFVSKKRLLRFFENHYIKK